MAWFSHLSKSTQLIYKSQDPNLSCLAPTSWLFNHNIMLSQYRSESSSVYSRAGHAPLQKSRVQALLFGALADDGGAPDCSSSNSSLKEQKSACNGAADVGKILGADGAYTELKKRNTTSPWKKCKKVQLSPNSAR